jgi:hypothetical protein
MATDIDIDVDVDLDAPTDVVAQHRPFKPMEPAPERVCEVQGCVALVDRDGNQCPVHRYARRLDYVMSGAKCRNCGRRLEKGEWVTRESTFDSLTHAMCPPTQPSLGRKVTRAKPLFDALQQE